MSFISTVLPIIMYILGSILLIVLIVLGIKLIKTIDKLNEVVDNVEKKVNSLNGLFTVIDFFTDTVADISDKFVDGVGGVIKKIFIGKKKKKKERIDEDE